jgi:hypothetical protein
MHTPSTYALLQHWGEMLQVLVTISQKFYCKKEACGYAKVIHKKEEKEKVLKKWTQKCLRYLKQ